MMAACFMIQVMQTCHRRTEQTLELRRNKLFSASLLLWCLSRKRLALTMASNDQVKQELQDLKANADMMFLIIMGSLIFCKSVLLTKFFLQLLFQLLVTQFWRLVSPFSNVPLSELKTLPAVCSATTSIQVRNNKLDHLNEHEFKHWLRNWTDISTLAYMLIGYGLSFGGTDNAFCGTKYFALVGVPDKDLAHCFFHYTFASCAGTIVSGVVHERCTMTAYLCYTILISGWSYYVLTAKA